MEDAESLGAAHAAIHALYERWFDTTQLANDLQRRLDEAENDLGSAWETIEDLQARIERLENPTRPAFQFQSVPSPNISHTIQEPRQTPPPPPRPSDVPESPTARNLVAEQFTDEARAQIAASDHTLQQVTNALNRHRGVDYIEGSQQDDPHSIPGAVEAGLERDAAIEAQDRVRRVPPPDPVTPSARSVPLDQKPMGRPGEFTEPVRRTLPEDRHQGLSDPMG